MEPLSSPTTCRIDIEPAEPCAVVIFGASGDLARRKLLPALLQLHQCGALTEPVVLLGAGRTSLSDEGFRRRIAEELGDAPGWPRFAARLFYQRFDYHDPPSFQALADRLARLTADHGVAGNHLFYLAVPPSVTQAVARGLGLAGLHRPGTGGAWARIVVEKPFGVDLSSAQELEDALHQWFDERQIFRIDHYLAKETVQNILVFRFANTIFEPVWNRSYIDYVGILAAEELGVEHRAGYYESAGVIRDMFQNHLMQLLALSAMEPPSLFAADWVQDEKVKVFRSLKPFAENDPAANLVLGQYGPGTMAGRQVAGYRQEPGVAPTSLTPTFAAMRLFIDNWRWRGVPFYLISGKRLPAKITRVVVQFKEVPHSMFRCLIGGRIAANRLVLGIAPQEEIRLTFQAKRPGPAVCTQPVAMRFEYQDRTRLDAYARVLLDCLHGDHMLFWRRDGIETSWAFLDPILTACEECGDRAKRLHCYPAGSWGPEAARPWIEGLLATD